MNTLDIRQPDTLPISQILFADDQFILKANNYVDIQGESGRTLIHIDDVDHLILALQKAKELWG